MLDPTFNDMPTKTAELSLATYVPLYAYDGAHKYRAKNAESAAPSARVATGPDVPVHAVSALAKPAFAAVGSRPSVSSTPVQLPPTQPLQPNAQRIESNAQPSSNVAGVRPSTVIAATPKARPVASTHRKGALTQKGHARHHRHVVSHAARLQHARSPVISQNERLVIPIDSTQLPHQQ